MGHSKSWICAPFAFLSLGAVASAQVTTRVSVDSAGAQGNNTSFFSSISSDGRFVAFRSEATDLVPGDTNGFRDMFVRDLQGNTTEIVSVHTNGTQSDGVSDNMFISADGRFVAFDSDATNLVAGDTNVARDVFVRDRQNGTTERVSVESAGTQATADSFVTAISADGRYVVFHTLSILDGGDANGDYDVFVRDRQGSTTERVSVTSAGALANSRSDAAAISADGQFVVFQSQASNLVPGDSNGFYDVFVRDRVGLTTVRVSVDSASAEANERNVNPAVSADGRYVAFQSVATNLVPGDTNGVYDVFVRDRVGLTTVRVSVDSSGAQANAQSLYPTVSSDGRYVAFNSDASDLVAGDTNGEDDIFVRDLTSSTTERMNLDSNGLQGDGGGPADIPPSISGDGRFVAFFSDQTNLVPGDTNGVHDVFVRERGGGTEQESTGLGGVPSNGASFDISISADDRYVAFESDANNLVIGDTNGASDIFLRDRQAATTTLISVDTGGTQGNGASTNPSITADGHFVAFDSVATNLVAGDTNGAADVFVRDLQSITTIRASVTSAGAQALGASTNPAFAPGGSALAFESTATNLVAGDTNTFPDVFVRDLAGNTTTRASVTTGGVQGNGASGNASLSTNGLFVAFDSLANNLVTLDSNLTTDVFVRDRQLVSTVRVSVDSGGTQGLGASEDPWISGDGRYVAFESAAGNLVSGDSNLTVDTFVRDRQLGSTVRVSVASDGSQGLMWSGDPSISADGRHVAFASDASNLVGGDANTSMDIFVRDLLFATTERMSVDSSGVEGAGASSSPSINADGRHVAFESVAPNLVIGDTNGFSDAFVRDHGVASAFEGFCPGDGTVAPCPCANSGTSGRGCQNSGSTGGALLTVTGVASLSADTVQFTSSGERPTSLSIFLQGTLAIAPINYGDGVRCTGGNLKRLYTKTAVGGVVVAPQTGELSISARSAQLNATIPLGATRPYQVYYRDGAPAFCPDPPGSTFNVSNGFLVAWGG